MTIESVAIILAVTTLGGFLNGWLTGKQLMGSLHALIKPNNKNSGEIPALKSAFSDALARIISDKIKNTGYLEKKLSDPALFEKLRPEIVKHVDHFLEHKLSAVFPLLYKFMGEKTLSQFKQAFLEETDILFPEMMKKYAGELGNGMGLETLSTEIAGFDFPVEKLKPLVDQKLRKLVLMSTFIGLIVGVVLIGCLVLVETN